MDFVKYRKIYFILSGILILASIACLLVFGLKPGIDFSGGSFFEVEYKDQRPSVSQIKETLQEFQFKELHVRHIGERGVTLQVKEKNIPQETQDQIIQKLEEMGDIEETSVGFEAISPIIGEELKGKTQIVIVLTLIVIVIYIALAFRKISRPIASWQYGIASVLALSHDILITFGLFAVLGHFYDVQITIPVITAFLVILGYSINNTVVVFDRIRENLLRIGSEDYVDVVNHSLKETLTRSINTSLTTLFVLVSLFFLGGETLRYFSLALITGIIVGTYSSFLLAGPLLVSWLRFRERRVS